MIYITAVKMSPGGSRHEHISHVRWTDPSTAKTGENARGEIVSFIDDESGDVRVRDGQGAVEVRTVHPAGKPAYVRTYADGRLTDNLLQLPRYQ